MELMNDHSRQQDKSDSDYISPGTILTRIVFLYKWPLAGCLLLLSISQIARLFIPLSTKYLIDLLITGHEGKLFWLVVIAFLATTVQAGTTFGSAQLLSKIAEFEIMTLRKQLQSHVLSLPLQYFTDNQTGATVSRIMSDVEGLRNFLGAGMMELCMSSLTAVICVVFLFTKAFWLTLSILLVQSLVAYLLYAILKRCRPLIREGSVLRASVTGRLSQSLLGIRIIKGYRAEEQENKTFAIGMDTVFANAMRSRRWLNGVSFVSVFSTGITIEMAMLFGGRNLIRHTWTVGDYVQYAAILAYVIGPVYQFVSVGTSMIQALASLDRISEVLRERPEETDVEEVTPVSSITGDISVEHVDFSYEQGKYVLKDISFVASRGTITALVGPSGAGKSTLIGLLCGLYKPLLGRILVDGNDVRVLKMESYRKQLGLVLQESFLFSGSIRENIMFSRPNATEAMFYEAVRASHVDQFVEMLPERYETLIGEHGFKLSGGQRQRLAIARAILANPRILVLDEATSSLDAEAEDVVTEALRSLAYDRTTFIIAHRLSTICAADQILFIESGRIVERGTHEALIAKRGRYHEMYTRQHRSVDFI
jgi:ABC-type multidrug transport system fused ATPase/permease subunit